jgi:hypothetical protein
VLCCNFCIVLIHKRIRYCVVSLAVVILVTDHSSYIITVSHHKCVLWVVIIQKILHIHTFDVWTKPASWLWTLCLNKLVLYFLIIFKLFLTANSFNTLVIAPFSKITEHCIPVLCDVVKITTGDYNFYRWDCWLYWHIESGIFFI